MKRPFVGWYIVAVGFFAQAIRVGLGDQTFGFFFKPMQADFGWSRSLLSGGISFRYLLYAGLSPMLGRLVDRCGLRFMMVGSAVILAGTFVLLAQVSTWWTFLLVFVALGVFGIPGMNHLVVNPLIAKWFIQRRGVATSIAHVGINVGAMLLAPLIVFLLRTYDWRVTCLLIAPLPLVFVAIPALLWLHREPEDLGLRPDNSHTDVAEITVTPSQAIRTATFWFLLLNSTLIVVAWTGDALHRVPFMADLGFSSPTAAFILVLVNTASLASKLLCGWLADRVNLKALAVSLSLGSGVGVLLLINASEWQLWGYALVYGASVGGAFVLDPLLWAAYFGRKFQGTIRGLSGPFILTAAAVGPFIAATCSDWLGSYTLAYWMFAGMFVLAGAAVAALPSLPVIGNGMVALAPQAQVQTHAEGHR